MCEPCKSIAGAQRNKARPHGRRLVPRRSPPPPHLLHQLGVILAQVDHLDVMPPLRSCRAAAALVCREYICAARRTCAVHREPLVDAGLAKIVLARQHTNFILLVEIREADRASHFHAAGGRTFGYVTELEKWELADRRSRRALAIEVRVSHPSQYMDQTRQAEAQHRNHQDRHDARQADLDVIDNDHGQAKVVNWRLAWMVAHISGFILPTEQPHIADQEPDQARSVQKVAGVVEEDHDPVRAFESS
mmetsp:Transcript_77184/g.221850  ORF Transcript_77184/g.221850 Transcript_77184/m.221850 type:complete len:248 (-) Transcript_77184:542-1285(-)